MITNSTINEGLAGIQQNLKRLQQTAHDLSKTGLPTVPNQPATTAVGSVPATNFGTSTDDLPAASTIEAGGASYSIGQRHERDSTDLILQQMQQHLLFNASAKVVSAGNDMLGSLIDDLS